MSKIKWPALSSGSLGSDLAFNFGASGITASVGPEPRSLIALTPHLAARAGGKFHHAIGPNAIRSPMDEAFLTACGFQADSVRVLARRPLTPPRPIYGRSAWVYGGSEKRTASPPKNFCSISTQILYTHLSARSALSSRCRTFASRSFIRCSAVRSCADRSSVVSKPLWLSWLVHDIRLASVGPYCFRPRLPKASRIPSRTISCLISRPRCLRDRRPQRRRPLGMAG